MNFPAKALASLFVSFLVLIVLATLFAFLDHYVVPPPWRFVFMFVVSIIGTAMVFGTCMLSIGLFGIGSCRSPGECHEFKPGTDARGRKIFKCEKCGDSFLAA